MAVADSSISTLFPFCQMTSDKIQATPPVDFSLPKKDMQPFAL